MMDGLTIRRAAAADAEAITGVMGRAFQDDPVSGWLFTDPDDRAKIQPSFFRIFVDLTLADGLVLVADGPSGLGGVTLWLDVDPEAPGEDDAGELQQQFATAIGQYASRFFTLDELMTANHPHHHAHAYLPFVAVAPEHQGKGVGGALLSTRLTELDAQRRPAYLEASSQRNAALYARLGFTRMESTLDLPDGPSLYPMWRAPRAVA